MLQVFAEAEAGIKDDPIRMDAFVFEKAQALLKVVMHRSDDVIVMRRCLHGLRSADHVHDHEAGVGLCSEAQHGRICAQAGDIVDDVGSGVECSAGDGGFHGVDGDECLCLRTHGANDGEDAAQFFGFFDRLGTWAGGFAADVEDIGTFGEEGECVLNGAARIVEAPSIRKAVGRDIDDAHDEAAMGKIEVVVAESPAVHVASWREFSSSQ